MLTKYVVVALSLALGSAAIAEDAPAPSAGTVTLSAAKKANQVILSGGGRESIYSVVPGPNDTVEALEVIEGNKIVRIPGSTLSAGDKPSHLKTTMTFKEVRGS
jgi:hypothetical protein